MTNIVVETSKELGRDQIDSIKKIIDAKFNLSNSEIKEKINPKTIGGIIVTFDDYKVILTTEDLKLSTNDKSNLIIESSRELSEEEKNKYIDYTSRKFSLDKDTKVNWTINNDMIGGVRIRYKDEEVDMTVDKILDKAFSKI